MVVYQKEDVSRWVDSTLVADRAKAAEEANYNMYRDRISRELNAARGTNRDNIARELGAEQGKGQFAREKNGSSDGAALLEKEFLSKEAYQRNTAEGIANKPLSELFTIYKARRTQGK